MNCCYFFIITVVISRHQINILMRNEPWATASLGFPSGSMDDAVKICRVNTALLTKGPARTCSVGEWEVFCRLRSKIMATCWVCGRFDYWLVNVILQIQHVLVGKCHSASMHRTESRHWTSSLTLPLPPSFASFLLSYFLCSLSSSVKVTK